MGRKMYRDWPCTVSSSSADNLMANTHHSDSWNLGDPYERYVGRWSQLVALEFLDWLALPSALRWLDVGCGTGALTAAIRDKCRPARLTGIDPSDAFLRKASARLEGHATFHVASALELPLGDSEVDVVASGLALNFFPDPARGLREMRRVTTAGGTVAAYVWDYAGKMEFMRHFWDAAVELSSAVRELDEGHRFPLCRPEALENLYRAASLVDIEVRPIPTSLRDSRISMTSGFRSLEVRDQHRPMQCRWMRPRGTD